MFQPIVSKCILSLLLVPSVVFCASSVAKKDYKTLFEQYTFVVTEVEKTESFRIEIFTQDPEDGCIGDVDFLKDGDDLMHVSLIQVHDLYQEQGLGSVLLQWVMKVAGDCNCKRIRLYASPDCDDQGEYEINLLRLVAWYKRFGFEPQKQAAYSRDVAMLAQAPFKLDFVPLPKLSHESVLYTQMDL